mgnify:CR=1 FL=1
MTAVLLIEDDSVRAEASVLVQAKVEWAPSPRWKVGLELFNLANREAADIQSFYRSRLPGEPQARQAAGEQRFGRGDLVSLIESRIDRRSFQDHHWEGTFQDYLELVNKNPAVVRNAYQRLYDMILSHGTEEVYEFKEKVTRFRFFTEYATAGAVRDQLPQRRGDLQLSLRCGECPVRRRTHQIPVRQYRHSYCCETDHAAEPGGGGRVLSHAIRAA